MASRILTRKQARAARIRIKRTSDGVADFDGLLEQIGRVIYPSAAAMATPHAALRITRYMTSIEVPTGWLILPRARSSKPSYACQSSIASHTSMFRCLRSQRRVEAGMGMLKIGRESRHGEEGDEMEGKK